MSSVNTNKGAMVALETLRGINKNLSDVQSQISTGKKISSSTDNAAIWSIATVMESDVKSFGQVSDSLNLGSATVGVARSASEQVTNLLQEAKALIVGANDPSVSDADRSKYQTDLTELTGTIGAIVDSASFNGQNLLKGLGDIDILASLNRDETGTVTRGDISVNRNDLSQTVGVVGSDTVADADEVGFDITTAVAVEDNGAAGSVTITDGVAESRTDYTFTIDGPGATINVSYTAETGQNQDEIAAGIAAAATAAVAEAGALEAVPGNDISGSLAITASGGVITFANSDDAATNANDITIAKTAVVDGGVESGGLEGLTTLDISTAEGAETALGNIDALLQTAIDATAEFGSKTKRIDNQNEFITTLSDSLKTGVGALTDANLEEASARLQSLQVQQQLGVQALSIANQAPQSLLSLFR